MYSRDSLLDRDLVNAAVFGATALIIALVVVILSHEFSRTTAMLVGAVAVVPAFLIPFFVVYTIERSRAPQRLTSTHGVTISGVFYAEAVILVYAPIFINQEGDWAWEIALPAWSLALASAWAGWKAKQRRRAREDMARLAEANVNLATRFLVRPDKKGWSEIDPYTVLAYQDEFEKALSVLGTPLPGSAFAITDEQQKKLIAKVEETFDLGVRRRPDKGLLEYGPSYYPGVVIALVLAFLDAPREARERERSEWAAAMATRVNASAVRDSLSPFVAELFKKHAKRYRG
jgi:hypothetical protein